MNPLLFSPAWKRLSELSLLERQGSAPSLRDKFATHPTRFDEFSLEHDGVLLDYSKQRVDHDILSALHKLWHEAGLTGWITRMRTGDLINTSEHRAVLHTALREPQPRAEVAAVLEQMHRFCSAIHSGTRRGATREIIRDIVNIGIGGSDLGPRMATQALIAHHQPHVRVHFVSNLDAAHIVSTLAPLDPRSTLFIVSSKSFTTHETLANARLAREWLTRALGEAAIAQHFVAISTHRDAVASFGIDPNNMFEFWDWVGGRFSLWSAIGLPLMLAIGYEQFLELLAGAHAMDQHFFNAPVEQNLPATMALLGLWNTNFLGAENLAILPYSQSLEYFPHYLQQLEMESNGKQVCRDGTPTGCATAPIIWGATGTNGQHAFFQLLHQGGRLIPCDFIAFVHSNFSSHDHQAALLANCFAQSEALMRGKTLAEAQDDMRGSGFPDDEIAQLAPFKIFPGNQPSTTLLLQRLTPYTLGQLIALYEHKTFAQGILWGINSFDQWGVEYGKQLAAHLLPLINNYQSMDECQRSMPADNSTLGMIRWVRQQS